MGDIVKWPKKTDNPNSRKDTIRWCEFHMDIGHTTEECLGLRRLVAYLLKKGYLKDMMPSKNREDSGLRKDQERPQRDLPPVSPIYEVKFINGGSEICGLISSAAKKIASESKIKSPFKPRNLPQITFDDTDMQVISDVHGLVITMQIGTACVLRILVDGGSPVNLIMLDVLKAMKIDESQIVKKSNVLVGFSGETKNTLGEIYLPTYIEEVSSYERFGVLDNLSSYNSILSRPWIHNKMVGLTLEQQLAAALAKIKELETIQEKAAQAEAEITRLKESESSLKKKLENQASGSKTIFEPGTPFSSIIR
ncbi:uncharacterized protein LOC141632086 [Silene latifolia]|uniref:uncharacterized protein LOC141632086 n=1 Tax=Silene latifolia TaxID=37657 RepID=UPI003D7749DE